MHLRLTGKILVTGCCLFAALTGVAAPEDGTTFTAARTAEQATTLPVTAIPATRSDPRRDYFEKRHLENVKRAQKGGIDLLFLGDSITDQWSREQNVNSWEKHFFRWQAANFGVGGDHTQNVLWRITHGELDGFSPRLIVLMIGTNNSNARNSAEDIVLGIRKIIETIQAKQPQARVLLLSIFPRKPKPRDGDSRDYIMETIHAVNAQLPSLQDEDRVFTLDISQEFLVAGKVSPEIMYDGLHLTPRGYEIWAQAIAPTVEKLMALEPLQPR